MTKSKRTLKAIRKQIAAEVNWVDIKPYSHNIINLCLMEIMSKYGKRSANKAVEDFGLEILGWRKL